jgi:spore coat protein H
MNQLFKPTLCLLILSLHTPVFGGDALPLVPLDHFRGTRLQDLHNRTYQGAVAAANAGAGYEAVRLLQGLKNGSNDRVSKQASALLDSWGIENSEISDSSAAAINLQVRRRLELEFQAQVDLKQTEVYLEFRDFENAAALLAGALNRPIVGDAQKSINRFCQRLGLAPDNGYSQLKTLELSELAARIKTSYDLVQRIEAADFLLKADPNAGQMYWSLVQLLHPTAKAVRTARQQREEDPRSRFGFGGRTMPPGLIARFGNRFGGGRGEGTQTQESDIEPSVEGIIASLNFLAKDDTTLAIDLLKMGLTYLKENPEKAKLEAMLEQANLYALSHLPANDRSDVLVTRFTKKRKQGKAKEIFSGDWVPTYELQITPEEWEKLKTSPKDYASATFKSGDTVLNNIGVRLKGGIGSYRPLENGNKVALTLKLNQFEKGQKFLGLRKIVLNNSVQDNSYLREGMGYEIFREAGLAASRVGHANLKINGEPYGVYVQIEAVTSDFLKRWFEDGSGVLYEGSYGSDVTDFESLEIDSNPESANREHIEALANAADQAIDEGSLAPLKAHLDVVAFTRFMALEVLMDHWDGYVSANNYRLYRDTITQKFYFIPHGADQLFRNSGGELLRSSRGHIGQAITETPDGRELYLAQVRDLMSHVLEPGAIKERLRERYENVRALVALDPKNSNTLMDFDSQMQTTLSFFAKKQRLTRWQRIALDDPELSRRLESLNQGGRRFGGRGRGR